MQLDLCQSIRASITERQHTSWFKHWFFLFALLFSLSLGGGQQFLLSPFFLVHSSSSLLYPYIAFSFSVHASVR